MYAALLVVEDVLLSQCEWRLVPDPRVDMEAHGSIGTKGHAVFRRYVVARGCQAQEEGSAVTRSENLAAVRLIVHQANQDLVALRPAVARDRAFGELLRALVANPQDVPVPDLLPANEPGGFAPRDLPSEEGSAVEMVIVTPPALEASFQVLADWKTQKGVPTVVEFFGEPTSLPIGPAMLAIRGGAPILPVASFFRPGRGHHVVVRDPVDVAQDGSLRDRVHATTANVARALEDLIRTAPAQWHLVQPNWPSDRQ